MIQIIVKYVDLNINLMKENYSKEEISKLFSDLFQEIKHGDQEHQDWLEDKIKQFLNKLKYMNFGEAIEALKAGKNVAREGWNGKTMWLKLVNNYEVNEDLGPVWDRPIKEGESPLLPWIGMKTVNDRFVPWLASQTDILSEDWLIAE